jgi:ABC-2 type transport system ATP-binding protein
LQLDGAAPESRDDQVKLIQAKLSGISSVAAVAPHPAGVSLAVANASSTIPELLRRLDGDGVNITALQMTQPSLDDVFLKHTGRRIRAEAADQPIVMGW